MSRWCVGPVVLGAAVFLSACAGTPRLASEWGEGGRGGGLPLVLNPTADNALGVHMAFILRKQQELKQPGVSEEEREQGHAVLAQMLAWLRGKDEAALARTPPEELYRRWKVARARQEREAQERSAAVEAKLEEYLAWAERRWARAGERFHKVGREYLLTEHPLRQQSLDALTAAVLHWAFSHTEDPDFLSRSPSEVAVYLLARRSTLATAMELGQVAPPHLDYTPRPEEETPPEELALELLVGFVPIAGEGADLHAAVAGHSFTGRKVSQGEQLLAAMGVLLPFISGRALAGEELLERAALMTGRGVDEVRVLQRVATHLSPDDAREVERMLRTASREGWLTHEDVARLRAIAGKLHAPLSDAADTLRRGGKVPFLGVRTGAEGGRLVPGEPAHLAQCWVDYQFRHPDKYPRFSYAPDEAWEKLYRTLLKNKEAGGEFERRVLRTREAEKNGALMMPPLGSKAQGFIPDSVQGHPGELVWGRPYHFVEVKGRRRLDLGGNLRAMLDYVERYGGHVELWVRSAGHSEGPTRLSRPLRDRLDKLGEDGKATVRFHP